MIDKVSIEVEVDLEHVLNSVSIRDIAWHLGTDLLDTFSEEELLEFVGKEKAKQFFNLTEGE